MELRALVLGWRLQRQVGGRSVKPVYPRVPEETLAVGLAGAQNCWQVGQPGSYDDERQPALADLVTGRTQGGDIVGSEVLHLVDEDRHPLADICGQTADIGQQLDQIDALCEIIVTAIPQIEAKAVKPIVNLSRERSSLLPDLPTATERGMPVVQAYTWAAVYLPKGVAQPIVERLHQATVATMDTPAVREKLAKLGAGIVGADRRTPAHLAAFTAAEIEKWKGPVASSGAIE